MWDWLEQLGSAVEENWLPYTIATQGMSVIARMQAEKALQRKREAVLDSERRRQQALQQAADARLAQTMQQLAPAAQQQAVDAATLARVQADEQRVLPDEAELASGEYSGVAPGAPKIVKEAAAHQIAKALQKGRDYSQSLAAIGAYGDAQLGTSIGLGRLNQDIGRYSDFSRGSSQIVPFELDAARSAGQGWRTAHDIFGGLSDIGQLYGMGVMQRKRPQLRREPTMSYLYGTGRISD